MIVDKNRIFDGWRTLEGGVDAGRQPNLIDPNQAQSAINLTFRGGSATTRPGFRKLSEAFPGLNRQTWCFKNNHNHYTSLGICTFTPGSSGNVNLNTAATLVAGQRIMFRTTGTLPASINATTAYFILADGLTTTRFRISATNGGTKKTFATDGTGVHSVLRFPPQNFAIGEYKPDNIPIGESITLGTCIFTTGASGDITVGEAHGLSAGDSVKFTTTGTLPASINTTTRYFVLADGLTTTKLRISATNGGVKKTFATDGSGVHVIWKLIIINPWFLNENSAYIYRNGILQMAQAYSPHNGEDCIMAMIGGRLFKIVPGVNTAKVNEVVIEDTPRNLRNKQNRPIAYMLQADKWLIAQDGSSSAIVYDSTRARRSDTTGDVDHTEIPVGTIMAYGMGRIVVIVNERDVAFGDLYGSHDLPDPADSLLLFTERNFLAEGFDAAIPFTQGIATGMVFFPQLDTSTGNGQLMVFAERGASSFFLSIPRDQWKTSSFQILALLTTGLRGHRTISVVNEDLWFRSDDGMRSYRQARSEQGGWAHIPLSTNVRQFLENDSSWLLKYASAIYFDNRIICTTSPMWNNGRVIHRGFVVVDFDVISSFSGTSQTPQTSKPAWEGQWTSNRMQPIQLLTGTFDGMTRAFCFGMDSLGQNQLYELSKDDKNDWGDERIPWEMVSRTLDFQDLSKESTPFTENELYDGDLWLREIIE